MRGLLASLLLTLAVAACSHAGSGNNPGDDGSDTPTPDAPSGPICTPGTTNGCDLGHFCDDNGVCQTGCATADDCGTGEGCCDHACLPLDTLTDCGACGNTCATGDFCDGTQCNAPTFPSFCANKQVYVIYDDNGNDDHAADVMASTITANCPADVTVTTGSQTDATLVDQATGQPLGGGGVTYVLGGGPFPNKPLHYLEATQELTKVYFDAPDGINFFWRERATGNAVATMPGSQCSAHFDQFVTELVTDPGSGTLLLAGYGACASRGTLAAAFFYANQILPNAASFPDSWYVFQWDDTDGDSAPSAGDTFTVLAHGL